MKYVIIGGSAAGTAAAREIRSCDPHDSITMLAGDRSQFSRCQLHWVAAGSVEPDKATFVPADWAQRANVHVRLGTTALCVDPAARLVTTDAGEAVPYDRLLIATGARTAFPPIEGLQGPGTFGLRDLDDAIAIRAALRDAPAVSIIGAGLVGCELAVALAEYGLGVTLVEVASNPLPLQLDAQTGQLCERLLESRGIGLLCGRKVTRVERAADGRPASLHTSTGETLKTDMMICAAGVKANCDFLRPTGIRTGWGIVIDDRCRTSLEGIYAAGDVTESQDALLGQFMPSAIWPAAVRQGKVAGANMAGADASLTRNWGLRASVEVAGTSVVSLGPVSRVDPAWERRVFRHTATGGTHCVRVLYLRDGRLKAAILWGDVTNAGLYGEAILTGRDVTTDLPFVDTLDAAKRGTQEMSVL